MTPHSPPTLSAFRAAPILAAGIAATLHVLIANAQQISPPPANPAKQDDSTIVLSPFTVNSGSDVGYQAGNTLAGSRLNTKLSETPASVTVFTEEFLKDLGATSLEQVLEYGVNSNADYNAMTTAPSFFYMDSGLLNDVRVNNRGLFASKTLDFLPTTLPIDVYNTGRFDVASGPNSVLFGLGAAGGTVNAATRQPEFKRRFVNTTLAAGSWNMYRAETDINVSAVNDRIAVRLMAVHDESETWRRYGDRETDRWTAVVGLKPFKTTTVTALHERGDLTLATARPYNRVDSLSFWLQQGRPIVDNTSFGTNTGAVQNAHGIRGVGLRNIFVVSDGRPIFTQAGSANGVVYESASRYEAGVNSGIPAERQESGAYQTLLPTTPQADGTPHAPYDINYYGPENVRTNRIERTFLRLQQQIGREGFVELAYNRETGSGFAFQRTGDFALYGDPNRFVPNPHGTATRVENPRAGQLYTDEVPYHNRERQEYEVARATGSWRLDLGRFGDHRLAGMTERATNRFWTVQGPQILIDAATRAPIRNAAAPENAQNYIYRRNYVTEGAPETYIPATHFDAPIVYGERTYIPHYAQTAGARTDRREINSYLLATQSRFWKGRFIVTGGARRDTFDYMPTQSGRLTANDPRVISGERIVNEFDIIGENPARAQHYEYNTYTAGAVFIATRWLRVFYNASNNNSEPPTGRNILPTLRTPPPPKGKGRDWGLMLSFLDGRIFARATAYQTMLTGDPTVRDVAFINAHRRIINAFEDNGLITQGGGDQRSAIGYAGDFLSDLDTQGYELEVKASPTKNLTFTLAYSYTKLQRSKLGQEWYPWFEEQKAYYGQFPSTLLTTLNIPVSTEVSQIESGVESLFAANRLGYNNRPHKANVFARYTFASGRLKGFFVGGGARWQDRNIVQRALLGRDPLGKDVLGGVIKGPEIFDVDALVGYSTQLSWKPLDRATSLRVQVNIRNLLDNDDIQVIRLNRVEDGYWRVVAREPRSLRLTVTLGF